jgi:hypothetical protein
MNKSFSGGQPRQGIYQIQRIGDQLHLHYHRPDGGDAFGHRNVGYYKSLETFIEFCRRENFKICFNAMNPVHFCSITLRSNQMHYFYYLKLKTIYNISL